MKRTGLRRRARLRAKKPLRRSTPLRRTPTMAATERQRAAVAGRPCIVCGSRRIDAAHLILRSSDGCDDPLCVVPCCRRCHSAYDRGELDLLPHLEPAWRAQLAHAFAHVGLIGARITKRRPDAVGNYRSMKEERVEHITLTGDRCGEYVLIEERTDGSFVAAPDTSIEAIRKRAGNRAMTSEEFREHFGDPPSDGEG